MIDKYLALRNTMDWITNSSSEEFMNTFNQLDDKYDGMTLGEYIDLFIDTDLNSTIEYNIMTTDNFIFGAKADQINNTDTRFEPCIIKQKIVERKIQSIEYPLHLITKFDNASNDELYYLSCAA